MSDDVFERLKEIEEKVRSINAELQEMLPFLNRVLHYKRKKHEETPKPAA